MNNLRVNPQGRPFATDHAHIERVAFDLFERQGFDDTTMAQIAQAVGVSRRTLFRYFPSKNDIAWGQFDDGLQHFREQLDDLPDDFPLADGIHRCVVAFNDFDPTIVEQHRFRMRLILKTAALQAHSALRYADWRQVIADHVATRTGTNPHDSLPRMTGHISLALAISAYEDWLDHPDRQLTTILEATLPQLRRYLDSGVSHETLENLR